MDDERLNIFIDCVISGLLRPFNNTVSKIRTNKMQSVLMRKVSQIQQYSNLGSSDLKSVSFTALKYIHVRFKHF